MRQLKAEGIQVDEDSELQLISKITDELMNDFNYEANIGLSVGRIARLKIYAKKFKKAIADKRSKKHWLIIWPDNKKKTLWDVANFMLLLYSVFEIPFALAFLPSSCDASALEDFNLSVDCFFLCDCCLQFITAYVDPESGLIVTSPKQIIITYLRGWFAFDLLSSLPLDRIVCSFESNDSAFARSVKIIRCLKVIRFIRMIRVVQKLEEDVGSFASNSTRLLKLVGILLLCTHVCSCFWYGMIDLGDCHIHTDAQPIGTSAVCDCDGPGCSDWNWLAHYDPELYRSDSGDTRSRYLVSLYFAIVTLTTLGYGDVVPTNDRERLFVVALVIAGALMFSFLISSISSIVSQGNSFENAISHYSAELSDLCSLRNLPKSLRVRARAHASYTLNRAPYLLKNFSLLPRAIRTELAELLTRDTIGAVPALAELDADSRARLAPLLRPYAFPARQDLFQAMDTATEMYWLVTGEMDLLDVSGKKVGRARAGDLVGACEMFPEGGAPLRPRTARTRVRCELMELSKEDLLGPVQELLPDVFAAVRAYVVEHARGLDLGELGRHAEERSRVPVSPEARS